jgi:2-dehydro-3-deoxyphosphogluconate aldolase/(4S)-4-hydroxy-2-oxoglutarate aldolase
MDSSQILSRLHEGGLVAVIRAESPDQAARISEACLKGGASAIEVTFTVPRAQDVIADLRRRFPGDELILGAGSVLDPETARVAILEGASYIVSPCLNEETMRLCNRYRVPCLPGAMTIREVVLCLEAGAEVVKLFPGELFGPAFIKALKGPIPQARIMPTGGVSVENAAEWIAAGAWALGAGGSLTAGAKTGDYAAVEQAARDFRAAIAKAREGKK